MGSGTTISSRRRRAVAREAGGGRARDRSAPPPARRARDQPRNRETASERKPRLSSESEERFRGRESDYFSSNPYSCWASRSTSVRLGPPPTVNSTPMIPGRIVRKDIEPSGFLREATSLFHSPKSNIVAPSVLLTAISPSDRFA